MDHDVSFATDGDRLIRSSVFTEAEYGSRERTELVIDTAAGEEERLVDVNEDFELLADELEGGTYFLGSIDVGSDADDGNDDPVGNVTEITIDGDDTFVTLVQVYVDEDDVDLDELEAEFEDDLDEGFGIDDVSQDGRVVTADVSGPAEEFGS